jgi:SAM-dependent methyltransferase
MEMDSHVRLQDHKFDAAHGEWLRARLKRLTWNGDPMRTAVATNLAADPALVAAADGNLALRTIVATTARLAMLEARTPRDPASAFHHFVGLVHDFCTALIDAEAAGYSREQLRDATRVAREIHRASPFACRLQDWPRGYPGDFETIEWLYTATNKAEPGTLGWAIESYALTSAIAQQHRNKVAFQANCVREAMARKADCRVLSVACGSSPDIRSITSSISPGASFVLCDSDPEALAFSRQHLEGLGGRCRFVQGMVPRVLGRVVVDGPFDLIFAGGLFDYLPDRLAIRTLELALTKLLAPGGRLVFTNIAAGNPFRVWIEYLANWTLIERTEEDVRRLCSAAGLQTPLIERDATGLAMVVSSSGR